MTRPFPSSRKRLLTRRSTFALAAAAGAFALSPGAAFAQRRKDAAAVDVSVEELMKPGKLPDLIVGKADAPVTIIEYASLTCSHCATFHNTVFPVLKEKYVEPGKVRFILREFPLENLAAAAAMLTRCVPADKSAAMIGVLFSKQEEWAFAQQPVPELFKIAKQAGFTQESFDKCLTDQKVLDDVLATRERAANDFGVNGTPAFFINGKRLTDSPTLASFEKALAAVLKS